MLQICVFLFVTILIGYLFSDIIIVKKARRYHYLGRNNKGYHVHHSMYGIASFLTVPFVLKSPTEVVCLIGFGLGIIAEHTYHERFVFVEREKKS